ncbi:MAG: hypothetical protein PHX65_06950 [Sulfurimonas sp.]|nr:hypothetical protein [Sulfurimonas sp.]
MRKNIWLEKMLGHLKFVLVDLHFDAECEKNYSGSVSECLKKDIKEINKLIKLIKDTLKNEDDSKDKYIYFKVKNHRLMSWL